MNNILNTQEAFAAIQKGKQVLCRYAGNGVLPADKNFMSLDEVPASVFCQPHYEFCIKIEMLEIAGISFTKPCLLDEMNEGQQVFIVEISKNVIMSGVYTLGNTHLDRLISNGVVQRDLANAKSHLKAFQLAIGIDIEPFITDCDPIFTSFDNPNDAPTSEILKTEIVETPPVVINVKTAKRTSKKAKDLQGHRDLILDALKDCKTDIDVRTVCYKLEEYGFTSKVLKTLEDARDAKLNEIAQIKREAETAVFELKETTEPTDNIVSIKDAVKKSDGYQDKLAHLIECVWNAQTEVQANAILRYTAGWTAEQINPLQDEIDKRIAKIKQDTAEPTPEKPSMIVQILNAADETELDALEIDVASLDPFIQSEMKKYVDQRRDELAAAAQGKG